MTPFPAEAALLVIDIQNDFLPGGALAVPHGEEILPVVNALIPRFSLVVATQDWHPTDHLSFASVQGKHPGEEGVVGGIRQTLWPVHCVARSPGAAFAPELDSAHFSRIFYKGTRREVDSYSAFFDNAHAHSTGLAPYLKEQGVQVIYIVGLATEYCVFYSACDALSLGFTVYVLLDGCRGIDLHVGDIARALQVMQERGVSLCTSAEKSVVRRNQIP